MDTLILVILAIVALAIVRYELRLQRQDAQRRVRRYYSDTAQRAAKQRGGDVEEDALHIWRLKCAGQSASRREVTRRGEMTANRWNRASALITHLALDPAQTRYETGAAMIRRYVAEQRGLARRGSFVPPHG